MRQALCVAVLFACAVAPGQAAPAAGPTAAASAAAAEATATSPGRGAGPAVAPAAMRLAVDAIDACLTRLDPELDVGLARIAARCPRLVASLESSGVAAMLPADWRQPRNELSAGGLRALRRLLMAPAAPDSLRPAPDAAALASLVATTRVAPASLEPWERFMHWLRQLAEQAAPAARENGPWSRWLEGRTVPERIWAVLGYVGMAALLAFLAWIVRAELAAAGLLGARRTAGQAAPGVAPGADAVEESRFERLPLAERPGWLLQRLAQRLQALGRLPAAGALTARELARAARLEADADRDALRGIAVAAERIRFGAASPRAGELDAVIEAGATLLARLEAGASRAGARR